MSLNVETVKEPLVPGGDDIVTKAKVITIDSEESFKSFQQLVQRGTNLWPDAPAEIKAFADKITNDGKVQQEYQHERPNAGLKYAHYHKCGRCHQTSAIWTTSNLDPDYPVKCEKEVPVNMPERLNVLGEVETPAYVKMVVCGVVARFNRDGSYVYKPGETNVPTV